MSDSDSNGDNNGDNNGASGASDIPSIDGARARLRIERQREGFNRLAAAIAKAGYKSSAREFRAEAERAIARAEEFEEERLGFDSQRRALLELRKVLDDAGVPREFDPGRPMSDVDRVEWLLLQWRTTSLALATQEHGDPGF
jgi:hypothetical protein